MNASIEIARSYIYQVSQKYAELPSCKQTFDLGHPENMKKLYFEVSGCTKGAKLVGLTFSTSIELLIPDNFSMR